jgi:hypothetical protein
LISTKAAFVAAVAASSALTLSACGGSSDKSSSEVAPSASAAATSAAPSASASATDSASEAPGNATLPGGPELAATVATLIIPTTTPAQRTALVIGGGDLEPTLVKLDAYLKDFKVNFQVKGITQTGKTVKGNVLITSNGRPFPKLYPSFWQQKDSKWQLTRSGACSLIAVSGITCPDAPAS